MRHLNRIASKVAAQHGEEIDDELTMDSVDDDSDLVEMDILAGTTEYSCNIELNITANFEGAVSKTELIKKIKDELKSAITASMQVVSKDLNLESTDAKVQPIRLDCSVVDDSGLGDDEYGFSEVSEGSEGLESDDEVEESVSEASEASEASEVSSSSDGSSEDEDEDEDEVSEASTEDD